MPKAEKKTDIDEKLNDMLIAALAHCQMTDNVRVAEHLLEALRALNERDENTPAEED